MNVVTKHIIFNLIYFSLGILSIFLIQNSWPIFFTWMIMAFGNGTIGHRYFAHNQISVGKIKHWIFSFWCTLSAYSSVLYWCVQHKHHHRNSDNEHDIHSPKNGIFQSLLLWPFNYKRINSVFEERSSKVDLLRHSKDPAVYYTSKYFVEINLAFVLLLFFIDKNLIFCYFISFLIEHLRLGIINTILHINNFPGNYRNHNLKDNSQNNVIIGLLSLGFGWHNNHHHDPKKLILTENWWEVDLEGILGKILGKETKNG